MAYLEGLAVQAAHRGFVAAGLPVQRDCPVQSVRVRHDDAAAFARDCWVAADRAASCVVWSTVGSLSSRAAPVVVLGPGYEVDDSGEPVVHETLHVLVACSLGRDARDPFDASHTDARVWRTSGGPGSAQARAQVIFDDLRK